MFGRFKKNIQYAAYNRVRLRGEPARIFEARFGTIDLMINADWTSTDRKWYAVQTDRPDVTLKRSITARHFASRGDFDLNI